MSEAIFQTDEINFTLGKGKGKGSVKGFEVLGKGKKPKPVVDVIEPRTEEEQLEDAMKKCKKM